MQAVAVVVGVGHVLSLNGIGGPKPTPDKSPETRSHSSRAPLRQNHWFPAWVVPPSGCAGSRWEVQELALPGRAAEAVLHCGLAAVAAMAERLQVRARVRAAVSERDDVVNVGAGGWALATVGLFVEHLAAQCRPLGSVVGPCLTLASSCSLLSCVSWAGTGLGHERWAARVGSAWGPRCARAHGFCWEASASPYAMTCS